MIPSACVVAALVSLFAIADRPLRAPAGPRRATEALLAETARPARVEAWAARLAGVEVGSTGSAQTTVVRLYRDDGDIDEAARAAFERIAAKDEEPRPFAQRLEQLVFKAAYHFKSAAIIVVSGWRAHAGRHGTAEAIDFKLRGITAWALAAYLRGLPRAGVGVYTNRRTQYAHLDVREPSFHWLDASPPGVRWREAQIADRTCAKRDASWTPELDLP